jgi:carboxymethylenebutenolidase
MRAQEDARGYLAAPDDGTHPGVVMIPDVWGLADHPRDLARRLAAAGFCVLAIDPYRLTGRKLITDPASALAFIRELDDRLVLRTVQEAIDALAADPGVGGRPVGVTGFCMGGMYALLAACGCRGLAACVAFYGMLSHEPGLDPAKKPRSPLDAIRDLTCPVLGLYGEEDALIPVADVQELEKRLREKGRRFEVKLYPGAGHAFLNDTRPQLYRPEAAADAWQRMVRFFRAELA